MEVMEKKKSTSRIKIIVAVLLVLAIVIAGIVILQIRNAVKHERVMYLGGYYGLFLYNDGRFGFGNLSLSFFVEKDPTAPDLYRWDGDTLILEYGDSVGVLYFQKEGDTLVFQKERSVFPEDPRYGIRKLPDGTVLKKVEQ